MKKWRCMVCGWLHETKTKPKMCSGCGVPGDLLEEVPES